jgi:hypothetical protein
MISGRARATQGPFGCAFRKRAAIPVYMRATLVTLSPSSSRLARYSATVSGVASLGAMDFAAHHAVKPRQLERYARAVFSARGFAGTLPSAIAPPAFIFQHGVRARQP